MLKFSTIYIFLKQCCSIFGLKVHICSWKELLCNNIWNGVQRFYDQRNIYKCILYYQVYWLQFYLLCIYIHVQTFVLMFWFYFAFDFTRNYSIHVFIYSIYIYLGLIYLQYISRFGKHFKKTFLRVILLLFWTWPTVLPCLCNFSAFDLSHLTQLVLAFCVKSVDVHL